MGRIASKGLSFGIILILINIVFVGISINMNSAETLSDALVSYWKFDKGYGDVAYDSVGDNDGILSGGKFGNALHFDGVDDYVEVPDSPSLDITDKITVEAWVCPKGYQSEYGNNYIVDKFHVYGLMLRAKPATDLGKVTGFVVIGGNLHQIKTIETIPLNEWSHVAFTRDLTTGMHLYVNGVEKSITVHYGVQNPTGSIDNDGALRMGIYLPSPGGYRNQFKGTIDEVRISNIARKSFDLTTAPSADANTVALWHFDDSTSTTASDESGYSNDGTTYGAIWAGPIWTTGQVDCALNFDGVDDFVTVPDDDTLDIIDAYTISAWFKCSGSKAGGQAIVAHGESFDTDKMQYSLFITPDGQKLWAWYEDSGDVEHELSAPDTLVYNRWYHAAVVLTSDSQYKLYLDGVEKDSCSVSAKPPSISHILTIGCLTNTGSHPRYEGFFNGAIDEVKIWNRALNAEEILTNYNNINQLGEWLFNEGSGQIVFDTSGNNNNGKLGSNAGDDNFDPIWTNGISGNALKFDGTNDFVDIKKDYFQGSKSFSIEFWMKPDKNYDETSGRVNILYSYGNVHIIYNYPRPDLGCLMFNIWTGSQNFAVQSYKLDLVKDMWYYIVCTYDGSEMKIYINGELAGDRAASPTPFHEVDLLFIGGTEAPVPTPFMGVIDEVRIWGKVLDPDEIKNNYNFLISTLPDLSISASDISFSNPNPRVDETITINAMAHNIGYGINEDWTTKADIPTARESPTSAVVNGKIYVIGGWNGNTVLNTVEEYIPATDTWTTKTNMPTSRYAPAASVINGKIYVIGGREYYGEFSYNTVEEYDPVTNAWSTKTSMPTARGYLTSSVVDGKIYVIGGINSNGEHLNTVEEYDPGSDTWTTKTSISTARFGLTSSVVNNKIYVIGGGKPYSSVTFNTVEEYDLVTDAWTIKTPMPTTRGYLTSSVVDEKIYVIGGRDSNEKCLKTVEEYDPASDTWRTGLQNMPTERYLLTSSVVNEKIYTIGGTNKDYYGAQFNEEYTPGTTATALVSIYDGDPESVNILIDQESIIIRGTTTDQVSIEWTPTTVGIHDIYVRIENTAPCDADESNNVANKSLIVRPITATIDIDPDTLNLKSKGKWVTGYIELPEGYDFKDIDKSTVSLKGDGFEVGGERGKFQTNCLMMKFDRQDLIAELSPGIVELIITGELEDGTPFEGSDIIRVIKKGK